MQICTYLVLQRVLVHQIVEVGLLVLELGYNFESYVQMGYTDSQPQLQ